MRILRVKIGPKQSVPMHEHGLSRVIVYLSDQDFKVTSAEGKVEMAKHKKGDVSFAGQAKHTEENVSGQPFD